MQIENDKSPAYECPNNAWSACLDTIREHASEIDRIRVRWRRGGSPGRYGAGVTLHPSDRDDPDAVASAVLAAAYEADDYGDGSTVYLVEARTESGRKLGPWRLTMDPDPIGQSGSIMEGAARLFREAERTIGRLLSIIERQATAQASNMEKLNGLLEPLVRVRELEIAAELDREERAAQAESDARTLDTIADLVRVYLRARYGIDMPDDDDQGDDPDDDPGDDAGDDARGDTAIVSPPSWIAAQQAMRDAADSSEIMDALRSAGAVKIWRAAMEARTERDFRHAARSAADKIARRPKAARVIMSHPSIARVLSTIREGA